MTHLKQSSILFILFFYLNYSIAQDVNNFEKEAEQLASDLKSSLLTNLSQEIQKNGVESAIPFCHTNVKSIAKDAAKERIQKYDFGRTSHKIRNEKNTPDAWIQPYIEKFKGTSFNKEKTQEYKIHGKLNDGKKFYIEPLFVGAQCLSCHGENLSKNVKDKIQVFYPNDKATGFKAGEFRGFVWVKEK